MNTVGERLKTLREGMGLSQKKMAELLDVTQPSINRYEHGKAVPIEVLIGYADYFDVSMDYITCRCDEPQGKDAWNADLRQSGIGEVYRDVL